MAQVILHYSDGQDNLETFITPVFAHESLTTREYNEKVRHHIHQLLLDICSKKGYNTDGPNQKRGIDWPHQKKNIPELIKEITLNAPDGEEGDATFSWFITKGQFSCEPLQLEDLVDDYICDEQVLATFDEWAIEMRSRIEKALENDTMPIGTTIEFPDELEYFTEFPMGISEKAARYLKHSKYSHSSTEYSGTI